MSENRSYDSDAVRRILGISKKTLTRLRMTEAIWFTPGRGRYSSSYDAAYIDGLAIKCAFFPAKARLNDLMFYKLCTLQWHYDNVPYAVGTPEREAYLLSIRDHCKELVARGEVCTVTELAARLDRQRETIRRWGEKGRAAFFAIARETYVSRRYANRLVRLLTHCKTVVEAAEATGLEGRTIVYRINKGELAAEFGPDGLYYIHPAEIERFVAATSGSTVVETAVQLGVRPRTIRKIVARVADTQQAILEVRRLSDELNNLNTPFMWLLPLVMQGANKPQTLNLRSARRELGVCERTILRWCKDDLLPYFPTYIGTSYEFRDFVRLYVYGLRKFAGERRVSRRVAEQYRDLCKQKNCIV